MKFKIALLCIFLFFISVQAYSEVNIYLFSKVKYSEEIKLSDIGRVESMNESIDPKELIIDKFLFSDGLIDCKELRAFLINNNFSSINIYGTAARIIYKNSPILEEPFSIGDGSIVSGSNIKIILKNKKIKVVTNGIALGDGKIGEIIPVKLKNSRSVKGLIVKNKTVEIPL